MAAISGDQLRGHLEGLILAALERGTAHGWEIWRNLEAAGGGALALKEGSLYPALYRLESQALITFLQAKSWNSSMRRFENWESLDIEDLNPIAGA